MTQCCDSAQEGPQTKGAIAHLKDSSEANPSSTNDKSGLHIDADAKHAGAARTTTFQKGWVPPSSNSGPSQQGLFPPTQTAPGFSMRNYGVSQRTDNPQVQTSAPPFGSLSTPVFTSTPQPVISLFGPSQQRAPGHLD